MPVTIYPNEPISLAVEFTSDPLVPYGFTYADIDNIVMCLKRVREDSIDDFLSGYLNDEFGAPTGKVLLDQANHKFTLVKTETDSLPEYRAGYKVMIGVKPVTLTEYIWMRVESDDVVVVEADGIEI